VAAVGAAASPFLQAQAKAGQARRQVGLKERQFGLQERQVGLQERQAEQQRRALQDLLRRATGAQQTGEEAFLGETAAALPELAQVRKDILAGATPTQQRQTSQAKLALRQEGARGPQAALALLKSQKGLQTDLQSQLNRLALGEAERRRGQRAQFFAGKAARGQERALIPVDPEAAAPATVAAQPTAQRQPQALTRRKMPGPFFSTFSGGTRR